MSEPFKKLAAQLSQLFELEKADLDFGIHRSTFHPAPFAVFRK